MKRIIVLLLITISYNLYSQDSLAVETPVIVTKLLNGSRLNVSNVSIDFKEVINDSRCPKNVNCVRAGEAKVLVSVYLDGKLFISKIIEITPTTSLNSKAPVLYTSDKIEIKAINLLPYPVYRKPNENDDYYLQVLIRE